MEQVLCEVRRDAAMVRMCFSKIVRSHIDGSPEQGISLCKPALRAQYLRQVIQRSDKLTVRRSIPRLHDSDRLPRKRFCISRTSSGRQ
jgi:hypothetical protein